jgi:ComEC/Rec2-related protein
MRTLLCGVVLGICAVYLCNCDDAFVYTMFALTCVIGARACLTSSADSARAIWKHTALLCFACSVSTALTLQYHIVYVQKQEILMRCTDQCVFQGMVVARPERVKQGFSYEVQLLSIDDETLETTYAHVTTPKHIVLSYGDTLSFRADVGTFAPFQSDTGRIVAYDKLMESKNVHARLQATDVHLLGNVSSFTQMNMHVTDMSIEALDVSLPEPAAGLAKGIVFGVKDALDVESETLFRTTGLSHITVFSGSNVALLLAGVWFLSGAFPYGVRIVLSLVSLLCVLLGVGISPPTTRAGIMGAVLLVTRAVGKSASGLDILFFSVICMLLVQPLSLLYDISFQLSVLAVFALLVLAEPLELFFAEYVPRVLAALSAMTMSVFLVVTPWIAFVFGTFSPSSIIANMLVTPIVPLALLLSLLCAVVTLSAPVLSPIVAYPTEVLFNVVFAVAEICASLPYSTLQVPMFHGLYLLLWYGGLALLYAQLTRSRLDE